MIERIKTEHGRVVAILPDDNTIDREELDKAAAAFDEIGHTSNAGVVKAKYRSRPANKVTVSLTWRPDNTPEP